MSTSQIIALVSALGSIFSALAAWYAARNSKMQSDLYKREIKEMKKQFKLKNDIVFSLDWSTDSLLSRSKRKIKDNNLLGASKVYEHIDGTLEEIDNRVVGLTVENKSKLKAVNLEIEWEVHIPSIRDIVSELAPKFDVENMKYGKHFFASKNLKRINKLDSQIVPAFYIGKVPIIILKIRRIFYKIEGEDDFRVAMPENIEGNLEFVVQHKELPEQVKKEDLLVGEYEDWKGFGESRG